MLHSILGGLLSCLCGQIEADGSPEPCFCGIVPGEAAVQDYIGSCGTKCGMAWVRLASLYPSSVIGAADTTVRNCAAGLGADIELGIMRCISPGEFDGTPPPPSDLLDASIQQAKDALTMWRTVQCCPELSIGYILGQYQPLGPAGGVVGGIWTLSVSVD